MALKSFNDFIWDERWWFPNKVFGNTYGWKDLENQPGSEVYYPETTDLHFGILLGAALVILRFIIESVLLKPIGYKLGVQQQRVPFITPNAVLEEEYKQKRQLKPNYEALSKQTDWSVRQIEVWFRKRKKRDATPTIKKFCDSGWHFIFYTSSFIYGLCLLWNKPWFTTTKECWVGWPQQHVSDGIYWYYMIELAFYCSLIFTLLYDHKRADFVQMIVHHLATIVLIYFSWISNFVRVGSLVLLIHDVSDPWLELAKMGIYLKRKTLTDVAFGIFVLVWTVARHYVLPFIILYTTTIEVLDIIDAPTFVNYFFNFFLYLLLMLTCIWSYHIYKMVYKTLTEGDIKDSRSDSEADDDDVTVDKKLDKPIDSYQNGNNHTTENGNNNTTENGNCHNEVNCHAPAVENGNIKIDKKQALDT